MTCIDYNPYYGKVRVFRPVFRVRLQQLLLQWRTMFKSRAAKIQAEDVWLDSITPVGGDPLKHVIKYNTWASKLDAFVHIPKD